MTHENSVYRRLVRRETHAPRTAPAVVSALVLLMMMLAVSAAVVWWFLDSEASSRAETWLESLAAQPWLQPVGAALILAAVIATGLAVLPGKRARHARIAGRIALVVDDGVLANSVVDRISERACLPRAQVSAKVGRSGVTVQITPTSGVAVDREAVQGAAEDAVTSLGFGSRVRVFVADRGVVA